MRVFVTLLLIFGLLSSALGQDLFQVSGGGCGNDATRNSINLNECHGMCDSRFKIEAYNSAPSSGAVGGFVFNEYSDSSCSSDKKRVSQRFVCPKVYPNNNQPKYTTVNGTNYNVFCFNSQVGNQTQTETPAGNSASTVAISALIALMSLVAAVAL